MRRRRAPRLRPHLSKSKKGKEGEIYTALYYKLLISKALRYGPRVTRGSHSFICHPHTNHTCLYSPAARHHRPLAGTHSVYPRRDGQAELTCAPFYLCRFYMPSAKLLPIRATNLNLNCRPQFCGYISVQNDRTGKRNVTVRWRYNWKQTTRWRHSGQTVSEQAI